MDKFKEVITKVMELIPTLLEGLEYVRKQLEDLKYEEAFSMLINVAEGIESIDKAIEPIMTEFSVNSIQPLRNKLINELNTTVTLYENKQFVEMKDEGIDKLIFAYQNWQEKIQKTLSS